MGTPPSTIQFKKTDFPSTGLGSQSALDKFFTQLNPFLRNTAQSLTGGLTVSQNSNAQLKTVTVTTPATDWAALTLANGWTPFANSIANQYRVDQWTGEVQFKGLIKGGSIGAGKSFHSNVLNPPPQEIILVGIGNNGSADVIQDVRAETTGLTGLFAGSNSWLALDNLKYMPAVPKPGVLSCFPFNVVTTVAQPQGVTIESVTDTSSNPVPVALGGVHWQNQTQGTGSNSIQILNIPGLLFGRTYSITLQIIGG